MKNNIKLFLVDDDILFLKLLKNDFKEYENIEVETYTTGEMCIAHLYNNPSIIILDYHLDGIVPNAKNGIEILDEIQKFDNTIPVIMLSSQDKIEVAVECMHHKAFDYVVKSETTFLRLKKIIATIQELHKIRKTLAWYIDHA